MAEQEKVTAADVSKLKLVSFSFSQPHWDNPKNEWKAEVKFSRSGGKSYSEGIKEVNLSVNSDVANEMMRFLMPIITQQASNEAQKLADEAKALAIAVGDTTLKSLPEAIQIPAS